MIEYENLKKLNAPFFKEFRQSFESCMTSGRYILSNSVENFEKEFAKYNDVKHCIGVNSGLDALILGLNSFNFPENSEVIVPSNTYIATILAIFQNKLKPVLVEPDLCSYNINVEKIEEKITPKTVAILPVHLYGKTCKMDKIIEIATKYDLRIIEDAAQAHGSSFRDKKAGTFGDIGAFSFYPTKNLGTLGDGGAILTNNDEIAQKIRKLRNYGTSKKYYNDFIGFNSRLDEMQAGFLSIKLKKLDIINNHKRKFANIYLENLNENFVKPNIDKDYYDVYHIFNIRHPKRDLLKQYLLEKGIKTEIHYPIPPHKQKAMHGLIYGEYPIAEEIHQTTLSLPISYSHTEEDILYITKTLNKF
ncbi:MAG: DegT/DnrJ/EryC1/StrS family aminotransferase [Candidatus Gastranaerophilales bacterium]|nr:DegT/DnrJ/EryC1/StrS family aminotransferase [Candidatus Gastranaerophilales bacterium]